MATLFTTDRLFCRQWLTADLEAIYSVYADEEGARWVGDGQPITRDEAAAWLDVTFNNYQTRGYGMSTVVEIDSDEITGFCGLVHPGGQEVAEIKYAFRKTDWGRGYASEVVPAMLDYGAQHHGLNRIFATVAAQNKPSQRVLEKSGMNFVEEIPEDDGAVTFLYEWLHG